MSCATFCGLPDCSSLSARTIASTSSVTLRASTSGATSVAAHAHVAAPAMTNAKMIFFIILLPGSSVRLLLGGVAFGSLAVEELADKLLEHDGRLGELERLAVREVRAVTPGLEPDVLLAEEARGEYRRGRVLRKLVLLVEVQRDARVEPV